MHRPQLPQQHPHSAPTSRMTAVVAFYAGVAILGVIIAAAGGSADVYRVGAPRGTAWLVASPLIGVAIGLVLVAASQFATARWQRLQGLRDGFRDVLGPLRHRDIVMLAVSSSLAEEILFRGALLPWLGLGWQAALFGLLHIGPDRRFWIWTVMATAMGLVLGALTLWVGDIGAAIAAHFVVNYLNLRFIAATPAQPSLRPPTHPLPDA
ncbi:MAG: CPBP family intramembrane metalloprotease [Myxococcales bacterium]|nr:CPBP family intramembrane metalloprotease [Myxococcales bacterium]